MARLTMKPSLYIETTVPSYYVSRDSRDLIVLAHQQITRLRFNLLYGVATPTICTPEELLEPEEE